MNEITFANVIFPITEFATYDARNTWTEGGERGSLHEVFGQAGGSLQFRNFGRSRGAQGRFRVGVCRPRSKTGKMGVRSLTQENHDRRYEERKVADKRKIEIFTAGCALCNDTIEAVQREACSTCEIILRDMRDARVLARAKNFGIRSIPAVVIDDKLVSCCTDRGVDIEVLKSAGLGKPL